MKSFLINLFKFGIYTLSVYVIAVVIFGLFAPGILKKNLNYKLGGNGFLYSRLQEAKGHHKVDVLFIGSSHAYRGYDSRIFSDHQMTSFNLGSSAQPPIITEIFIKKYLDKFQPKLVIFDVYPKVFGSDGVESSLDVLANEEIDRNLFKLAFDVNHIKTYNVLIYSWFRQKFGLNKNFRELKHRNLDTYIEGGYVESYQKYKPKRPITNSKYELNAHQFDAFKQIIAILKDRKTPYVLIQSPISQKLYHSISNNTEMDSIYTKYGRYYNFNNTLKLPDSLFFDDNHLNQNGVNIFNQDLIKTLHLNSGLAKNPHK